MHVARRLAPRHHPARHRKGITSEREAAHAHGLLQPRQAFTKHDALEPAPKVVVVDGEQGQVALDADREHARDDLRVGASAAALDRDVVVDAVGVLYGFELMEQEEREGENASEREEREGTEIRRTRR